MDAAREEQLRILIQRVARRIRVERGADVSDGRLAVIAHLHEEGPLTPGALAEKERVSPPSMNRTVNHLVEAGWARRDPSADDARKVLVSLTDEGRALIAETKRRRSVWFHDRLAEMSPAETAALEEVLPLLRRLADS